jgi:tRNA(fMet)-specific endonuclease VapC
MARLIDSNVFIALERRGLRLAALEALVAEEIFAIAAITASELLTGVMKASAGARRETRAAFVEAVIAWVPIVPFDLEVARTHARIGAQLATSGQSIGSHDLMIAATAITYGYGVLTDNLREFQRIPDLTVSRPDWPLLD